MESGSSMLRISPSSLIKRTPESVRLVIETLPYQRNVEEIRLAALSEQMRLLYVAMTRAERKLYLVGKGRQDKLEERKNGEPVSMDA